LYWLRSRTVPEIPFPNFSVALWCLGAPGTTSMIFFIYSVIRTVINSSFCYLISSLIIIFISICIVDRIRSYILGCWEVHCIFCLWHFLYFRVLINGRYLPECDDMVLWVFLLIHHRLHFHMYCNPFLHPWMFILCQGICTHHFSALQVIPKRCKL
jgi:hypothetical protein